MPSFTWQKRYRDASSIYTMKFTYKISPSNLILCPLRVNIFSSPFLQSFFFFFFFKSPSSRVPDSSIIVLNTQMTNPNVVVSDTQSAIAMAISVNTSSLYSPSVPNSPYNITLFPRNKFPKSIETSGTSNCNTNGITKNIAWVDAMRASSPTRNTSEDNEEKKVWIVSLYF